LVVTGSDLCVFSRKLVPGRKEHTSHELFAANGAPIPTYGGHTLTLNPGLRHDFTWSFVVADAQNPIIGVDLLGNFGLLVDCRNNRILDRTTSLLAHAETASLWLPSVKTFVGTAPAEELFTELLDLTRPSGVRRATTRCTTSTRHQAHQFPLNPVALHQTDSR